MIESVEELRTFRRIVDEGSLSAAARTLGLSVNAVSRRLAQLEQRLGVQLAERTTRRLTLTDEGQRFAEHCRRILHEIDEAEEEVRPAEAGLAGLVRVAIYPELLRTALLSGLSRLLAAHPELRMHVVARSVPGDPGREGVDIGVWPGEVPLQSVVARHVVDIHWVLTCSAAYARRHGVPRRLTELSQHECLRSLRGRTETHWLLQGKGGKTLSVPVSGRFESDDNDTLRAAVLGGLGIGLRPRGEVMRGVRAGRLVHVLPAYTYRSFPVYLVSAPGRLRLSRVRAAAELLEAAIKEIA